MWNAGYRERTADDADKGKAGTVHDVEADRIPQQIDAAGGKLAAVLPQGHNKAGFGIADPQAYVKEVMGLATPDYRKQAGKPDAVVEAGNLIISGHSGGGRAAMTTVKKLDKSATPDEWATSPPLLLFDGINGTTELDNVVRWVEGWLDKDLAMLRGGAEAARPAQAAPPQADEHVHRRRDLRGAQPQGLVRRPPRRHRRHQRRAGAARPHQALVRLPPGRPRVRERAARAVHRRRPGGRRAREHGRHREHAGAREGEAAARAVRPDRRVADRRRAGLQGRRQPGERASRSSTRSAGSRATPRSSRRTGTTRSTRARTTSSRARGARPARRRSATSSSRPTTRSGGSTARSSGCTRTSSPPRSSA